MHIVAIIAARGGSKRLPRKNILPLAGRPLIAHSIEHALRNSSIQRTLVSTEDPEIATIARAFGAEVIPRPSELAGDTVTSEAVLHHVLDSVKESQGREPDLIVFLQCTSPIRRLDDISNAVQTLLDVGADSLFSAARSHWLFWRLDGQKLLSVNYDYTHRQRDQELPEGFRENGSIYVFKPWVLREFNNRLGGKIALYEMDYWSSFQVDSQEDLDLCEWILQRQSQRDLTEALPRPVKAVIFDFDGVFTDNRVLVHQDGTEAVFCDRTDGLGISYLKAAGIAVGVLSTEKNPVVSARCGKLGIPCYQGASYKHEVLQQILEEFNIGREHLIYVGNDLNDLECVQQVGCGVAVADAHPTIRAAARIILKQPGGKGAVRELCDLILQTLES